MKLQTNVLLGLLSILLVFASISCASGELNRDPTRYERQCEHQCERQEPYFEEQLCKQKCQERERQGWRGRRNQVQLEDTNPGSVEKEYERCQQTCRGSGTEQWQCQRKCEDDYEAALKRERERRGDHEHEHERKREREREEHEHDRPSGRGERYPREHDYSHCLHKCDDREEGFPRQRQCKLHCEQEFGHRRERKEHRHREGIRKGDDDNSHKTKEKEESNKNPYYFDSQSFESRYSTEDGQMRVLQRFSEKSELFLGIDKFRVAFFEANPNTFMLPHHWDADSILFVNKGNGAITILKQENRKTFNVQRGDVLMIPAGTTTYLINSHNDEKLEIAELLRPVNTPGRYQQFFGVCGKEPKSFFNTFSTEILEAALNVPREQLEKLFKQQKEGAIIKASREQVRTLAHGKSAGKQFGESRDSLFNLLDGRPQGSNEHGEYYEVTPNEYQMLENLDASVGYVDIKQGSMLAPHYNSRTTYIVMVEEGSGYFEMACPHLGNISNKKQRGSQGYEKVRSLLSKGDVFVVPAGHPITLVASENEGLRAVGFGINAQDNQRNFLAGQNNIIEQLDETAMELSFNMPAREVEVMFQKQQQSYFMAGPQRHQRSALVSVLDFAGF